MNKDGEFWAHYTTGDDSADDPSCLQDACHIWTQLNDLALNEFL